MAAQPTGGPTPGTSRARAGVRVHPFTRRTKVDHHHVAEADSLPTMAAQSTGGPTPETSGARPEVRMVGPFRNRPKVNHDHIIRRLPRCSTFVYYKIKPKDELMGCLGNFLLTRWQWR